MDADILVALAGIISVNILLSGDNALVIALASRNLPPEHQKKAVFWGGVGAIVLRIGFAFLAIFLLKIPYLQMAGAIALEYIAIKLLTGDIDMTETITAQSNIWKAIKTIIAADVVMSIDNTLAIAAAAKGNIPLIVAGTLISIPIILWGSTLIHSLMERWPVIIVIGAAFLGWTAGGMFIADSFISSYLVAYQWNAWLIPGMFAFFVILAGQLAKVRV